MVGMKYKPFFQIGWRVISKNTSGNLFTSGLLADYAQAA